MSRLISTIVKVTGGWTDKGTNQKEQVFHIDSKTADCLWHKVSIHGVLAKNSNIEVTYFVSNHDIGDIGIAQSSWAEAILNQKHVPIDASKGQWLLLKITITSNKTGKYPKVTSLKAYFSSVNYLNYLPAFYQEDPVSLDFFKRYLAVFEAVLQKLENQIEETPEQIDAKQTSSEFLPWLSTWVGAVKDENWPENKWREFLSRAAILYRHRGTKKELEEVISIYTGKPPVEIVERALLKTGSKEYQALLDTLFGDKYSFCVLLRQHQVKTETDRKVIKRIIESEKPAHTVGGYVVLENEIYLDWHTYLGLNTYLIERKAQMYVGKANVSINTVIAEY